MLTLSQKVPEESQTDLPTEDEKNQTLFEECSQVKYT